MHITFPLTFTCDISSKLPVEEDGGITEQNTIKRRQVEMQYLGTSKVESVEDSEYEHDNENRDKNKLEQS